MKKSEKKALDQLARSYPIVLPLTFEDGFSGNRGSGSSFEISKDHLRFTTAHKIQKGANIDVALDWPVRLDGKIPLRLCITGEVVSVSAGVVTATVDRHLFRTAAKPMANARSNAVPQQGPPRKSENRMNAGAVARTGTK